jgi:hypothetical protein
MHESQSELLSPVTTFVSDRTSKALVLHALKPTFVSLHVSTELSLLQSLEHQQRAQAGGSGQPRARPRRMEAKVGGDAL